MKSLLVLCVVAFVSAVPPPSYDSVQIVKQEFDNPGFGSYRSYYSLSDGTQQEQYGELKNEGREDESLAVRGSYSWVGPDGVTYTVNYVADENGFQPEIEQGPGGAIPSGVLATLAG